VCVRARWLQCVSRASECERCGVPLFVAVYLLLLPQASAFRPLPSFARCRTTPPCATCSLVKRQRSTSGPGPVAGMCSPPVSPLCITCGPGPTVPLFGELVTPPRSPPSPVFLVVMRGLCGRGLPWRGGGGGGGGRGGGLRAKPAHFSAPLFFSSSRCPYVVSRENTRADSAAIERASISAVLSLLGAPSPEGPPSAPSGPVPGEGLPLGQVRTLLEYYEHTGVHYPSRTVSGKAKSGGAL
jgi:hypothetical protein